MVEICQSLLKEPLLEDVIRAGDCLVMLVVYFHGAGRMYEAYVHLQDMEVRSIALHPYVDAQILEEVFKALGVPEGGATGMNQSNKGGGGGGTGSRVNSSRGDGGRDNHTDSNNDGIDSDIEEDMGDSPAPSRDKKNISGSGSGSDIDSSSGSGSSGSSSCGSSSCGSSSGSGSSSTRGSSSGSCSCSGRILLTKRRMCRSVEEVLGGNDREAFSCVVVTSVKNKKYIIEGMI